MSSLHNTVFISQILILRLVCAKQVKYVKKLYCPFNDKNTLPYIFLMFQFIKSIIYITTYIILTDCNLHAVQVTYVTINLE